MTRIQSVSPLTLNAISQLKLTPELQEKVKEFAFFEIKKKMFDIISKRVSKLSFEPLCNVFDVCRTCGNYHRARFYASRNRTMQKVQDRFVHNKSWYDGFLQRLNTLYVRRHIPVYLEIRAFLNEDFVRRFNVGIITDGSLRWRILDETHLLQIELLYALMETNIQCHCMSKSNWLLFEVDQLVLNHFVDYLFDD